LLFSYALANWLKAPALAGMLQWYALTLLISVLFAHFEMLLNAKMDFRGVCWMYCIRQGLLLAGIGISFASRYMLTPGLLSMFYLFSVVGGVVTGWWFSTSYLQWDFKNCKPWIGKLSHFGKYVFANNVSTLL